MLFCLVLFILFIFSLREDFSGIVRLLIEPATNPVGKRVPLLVVIFDEPFHHDSIEEEDFHCDYKCDDAKDKCFVSLLL